MKRRRLTETYINRIVKETTSHFLNEMAKYRGDMIFVTYLNEPYDISKFKPIEYDMFTQIVNKCRYGLWACPYDTRYGWKEFCEDNDFKKINPDNAFFFKLKPSAKIYSIHELEDIENISTAKNRIGLSCIDFNRLIKEGYDGIYVSEEAAIKFHDFVKQGIADLNVWDIESLCVFNPNVIIPVNKQ